MEIKLYLRMLQRSWWIVAITALVAVAAALVVAYGTTPIYQSTARYIVSPNPAYLQGDSNFIYSLDALDKQRVITTYAEVMNSPRIYHETLALMNLSESELTDYSYSAVVLPDTAIVELSVRGTDPAMVTRLNSAMGAHSVEYVEALYKIYDMGVLDPASQPTAPVSPRPLQDSVTALVVGIALGAALALLRELLLAPLQNFLRQRRVDSASLALKRSAFEEELVRVAENSAKGLCLGFIRLEGLTDYLNVLPQSTLDSILHHVTRVLKDQLRGNDIVGRWDGAVFAIALADTPGRAALNTMGRVATALSVPVRMDISEETLKLQPVIGLAEYRPGDTKESLVDNARAALDLAKNSNGIHLLQASEPALA